MKQKTNQIFAQGKVQHIVIRNALLSADGYHPEWDQDLMQSLSRTLHHQKILCTLLCWKRQTCQTFNIPLTNLSRYHPKKFIRKFEYLYQLKRFQIDRGLDRGDFKDYLTCDQIVRKDYCHILPVWKLDNYKEFYFKQFSIQV